MHRSLILGLLLLACGCESTRSVRPVGTAPAFGPRALAPRMLLAQAPSAPLVPYDRLLNAQGEAVDGPAMDALAQDHAQLEALYAEAIRGDRRALKVVKAIEARFAYYGRLTAERAILPPCLLFPEFAPGCVPHLDFLEPFKDTPVAQQLRGVTFEAYEARLQELAKRRRLNEASLNLLLAGAVITKPLAGALLKAEAESAMRAPPEVPPGAKVDPAAAAGALGSELAGVVREAVVEVTSEVKEARFAEYEASTLGPRLPRDIPLLERIRPVVERPPAGIVADNALWRKYVAYFDKRLVELKSNKPVEPPFTWEGYKTHQGLFERGMECERRIAATIQAEAKLPLEQRTFTKDFVQPGVYRNIGMTKGAPPNRFVDILIIEEAPGKPVRIHSVSVKSRDFLHIEETPLKTQILADSSAAKNYYGGVLEILRRRLGLRGQKVEIEKVYLIYDAGLKPSQRILDRIGAVKISAQEGVEVRFE